MGDIARMHETLRREYGHQDWSANLRAGPACLGIVGQCLLTTSRSDIITIELSGPGLRYTTLYANVSDVAHTGMETFRHTGQKMELISSLSYDLAKRGGLIETMLKFCNAKQGDAKDRHLQRCLRRSSQAVHECTAAIKEINEEFELWSRKTQFLLQALEEATSTNTRQAQEVQESIDKGGSDIKLMEEEKKAAEQRLMEHYARLKEVRETKEWYEDHVMKMRVGFAEGGFAAAAATVSAAAAAGVSLTVGAAAAYIHYSTVQNEVSKFEELRAQREIGIKQLASKTVELEATLRNLSSKHSSLGEVMKVVKTSVKHMTELQAQIQSFMDFLLQISSMINKTAFTSQMVCDTAKDTRDLGDPVVKQALLDDAFEMMTRFNFAARASAVYTSISSHYILPTINGLPSLRLTEDGSDEEIHNRMSALSNLTIEITTGAEELATRMHGALKNDIREIVEISAIPFLPAIGSPTDPAKEE